jgi:AAA15 family ATPase/GTPase
MKLHAIHIQNYKSLRDVTIRLQDVNLFIGPNNSGKSNALTVLRFIGNVFSNGKMPYIEKDIFYKHDDKNPIIITLIFRCNSETEPLFYLAFNTEEGGFVFTGTPRIAHKNNDSQTINWRYPSVANNNFFEFKNDTTRLPSFYLKNIERSYYAVDEQLLSKFFTSFQTIYKINPSTFIPASNLNLDMAVAENGENLVSFLFNIKENNEACFNAIEKDLTKCIPDFIEIKLPSTQHTAGGVIQKQIRFIDTFGVQHWSHAVSEGVLYFLALLCIVHQPNPPKLLLLEEPEKGIHPRRIKEIMDYIFGLAQSKDIQIIMTTHSTQVVDEFKDIPENIFVFDKENEETIVRNMQTDVIDVYNEKFKKPINLSGSLGDHWASGFLGGVPI